MIAECMLRRFIPLAMVCAIFSLPQTALALDAPHNLLNCDDCHVGHGATYPTQLGFLCQSCHYDLGPGNPGVTAPITHSSLTIDNSFGNWDLDCWACHDPHTQEQLTWDGVADGKFVRRFLGAQIKIINPLDPGPYYAPLSIDRTVSSNGILQF